MAIDPITYLSEALRNKVKLINALCSVVKLQLGVTAGALLRSLPEFKCEPAFRCEIL